MPVNPAPESQSIGKQEAKHRIAALLHVARNSRSPSARFFAWGELICFPLSLAAIVLLVLTILAKMAGLGAPSAWTRYALPMLLAAAIGYLTNYIAVRMLFQPYRATDQHWLRWITFGLWRQGLVPARKDALAQGVGREVAERLLTPEIIADELTRLVGEALDDKTFRSTLRLRLGPILRQNLPAIINRFYPEIMSLLREGFSEGLTNESVTAFLDNVIDPWLNHKANRDRLAHGVVGLLREHTPHIVRFLQDSLEQYKQSHLGWLRRALAGFAEWFFGLDWNKVHEVIDDGLQSKATRQRIADVIGRFVGVVKDALAASEMQPTVDEFKSRATDFFGEHLQRFLAEKLPEASNRLIDTPDFWRWLADEGLPAAKPHIMAWIQNDAHDIIGRRFNVAGRVAAAITQMDVEMVHRMADNISSEQLGAIQVLGFIIGFAAGTPLVLLL